MHCEIKWQRGPVVNALRPINKAALHRAWLVHQWLTISRQVNHLGI